MAAECTETVVASAVVVSDEKIAVETKVTVHHAHKIRNVSVIAHVDHGKTSLTDSILERAGLVSKEKAGKARLTDNRKDEIERGITIKSTGVTILIDDLKINLVDSPGHADFNSEVSAALRITDGAIVVVDAVEGVSIQTETVLRQALAEQVTPILVINKIDRYFSELNLDAETAYHKMDNIITSINALIQTYRTDDDFSLGPEKGNVFFTSALYNWGFGLKHFAKLYSKKVILSEEKLMGYLWGDYYLNPKTKKITTDKSVLGAVRVFNKLVYEVIQDLYNSIKEAGAPLVGTERTASQQSGYEKFIEIMGKLDINLGKQEMELTGKDLFKAVMQEFTPLCDALIDGMRDHLPSPQKAQMYRVKSLYDGPLDDDVAKAIRNCDPDGPLMIFISKNVPTVDNSRFYAFGRIFSGTVHAGQKVTILASNYVRGMGKTDFYEGKAVQAVSIMVGNKFIQTDKIPCGNTCGLSGIDAFFLKSATITNVKDPYPIKMMRLNVNPVVQVAIKVKNSIDLPKLALGIKKLVRSDPCVVSFMTDNGETVIGCAGMLHLEISLNDLREFMHDAEIVVSVPVIPFRETVSERSPVCLSKSPNGHNRIWVTAEPLSDALIKDLEEKNLDLKDMKALGRKLVDQYGWEPDSARKIWAFGPEGDDLNILVDGSKGVSYLHEVKGGVIAGFLDVCQKGPLAEEKLRGIKFTITDIELHADSIHRGQGQTQIMTNRSMTASILTGGPKLVEPYYALDVQVPDRDVSVVYDVVGYKGGKIINEKRVEGTLVKILSGYLAVSESIGFDALIRERTSGSAYCSMVFSHWEHMEKGDPLDPDSKVRKIIMDNRARKGGRCEADIPPLARFLDKL
ncbi:MAG: mimivirus elongation factor aef-2 [Hyperionvirus sp.]|uniref:Elongation factor 2 n=1 Tax=Hyperionvirus sp. TaxID=2487770 RepID=A0A3G5ABN6_9VIRU|nr:MAG: mimivirus elongation factor aef-2 [Hyperionvirus sp.]